MEKELIVMGNDSLFTIQTGGQKNVPFLVKEGLKKENINTAIFNISSTFFNKAEDLIAYLEHDISLKDIQMMYLMGLELSKKEYKGMNPNFIEKTILNMYINKKYYNAVDSMLDILPGEENLGLSEVIASKNNPTIVLSTFANELMNELCCDPITALINKDRRDNAIKRFENEDVLENIILKYEKLIDTILTVNENSKIICSGIYTPNSMKKSIYMEMVNELNRSLQNISEERNVKFLDINNLGNRSKHLDFHLSKKGSQEFSGKIINSIKEPQGKAILKDTTIKIRPNGIAGVFYDYEAIRNALLEGSDSLKYNNISDEERNIKISENKAKILTCEKIYFFK